MRNKRFILILVLVLIFNSIIIPYEKSYAFSTTIILGNPALAKAVLVALGWTGVVFLSGVAVYLVYDKFVRDWIATKNKPLDIVASPTATTFTYTQEFKDFTYNFVENLFQENYIEGVVTGEAEYVSILDNYITGILDDGTALQGWQLTENLWFDSSLYLDVVINVTNIPDGATVRIFNRPVTVVDGEAVAIQEVLYLDYEEVYIDGIPINWNDSIVVVGGVTSGVNVNVSIDYVLHTDKIEIPILGNLDYNYDTSVNTNVDVGTYTIPADITTATDLVEAFYPPIPATDSGGGIIDIPILGDIISLLQSLWDWLISILNSIYNAILDIPNTLSSIWDWLIDTFTGIKDLILDIPNILSDIWDWLIDNLTGIKDVILSIPENIGNIINDLFIPKDMYIDFGPLQNVIIKEKFPFSLPWDIYNIISVLSAERKAPKWTFNIKNTELIIDFSQFEHLAAITRTMLLITYILILIILTRRFI